MFYSKEDIERAKQVSTIDFIADKYGTSFIRQGSYFRCKDEDMSSLIVKSDCKVWWWNSHNLNGKNAIDWLMKVEGRTFTEAVSDIIGKQIGSADIEIDSTRSKNRREFTGSYEDIPKKYYDRSYKAAADYLQNVRGISKNVIDTLIGRGKIYQDTHYNVVFANLDDQGKIKYWCLRGTHTDKKFTKNMSGSNNPYYGYEIDSTNGSDTLYVFEAPIDLLSHCTIAEIKFGKNSWQNQNRLALCGVNDSALESYLARHTGIKTIKFCLDNDKAGITATEKLCKKYYDLGYHTQRIYYTNGKGKDLNEILCNYLRAEKLMPEAPDKPAKKPSEKAPEKTSAVTKSLEGNDKIASK